MNQAQVEQTAESRIAYVEPDVSDEPKTNPRIRVPLPLLPEPSGVVPRVRDRVLEAQRALSRLRFAPAVVIGALLGSAPYLVQEHAREERKIAHALAPQTIETSQLAATPAPPTPPAPQPPPAVVEFDEEEIKAPPSRADIERAVLQRARTLLRSGDAIGAQLILERLGQRLPHGMYVQQRKLLEIQVLQVIGGKPAAQRAAREFAKTYPHNPELNKLAGLLL